MFKQKIDDELQLVFLHPALAEELYNLVDQNRNYLSKWLAFPPLTKSVDDIKEFIKRSVSGFGSGTCLVCGIQKENKLVGLIGFNKISNSLKKVEIGYWLAEEHQGNGIMFRACNTMIKYAFNEMGIEKIEIRAASENSSSRQVCEKLGLTLEGIISHCENLHGEIIDHADYGLLKAN